MRRVFENNRSGNMSTEATMKIGTLRSFAATHGTNALRQPEEGTPLVAAGIIESVAENPFNDLSYSVNPLSAFGLPSNLR